MLEERALEELAERMGVSKSLSGRIRYGVVLVEFFRGVAEYMRANPQSELAAELWPVLESLGIAKRRPRRLFRAVRALGGLKRQPVVPRDLEDWEMEEAHEKALRMEARRLLGHHGWET